MRVVNVKNSVHFPYLFLIVTTTFIKKRVEHSSVFYRHGHLQRKIPFYLHHEYFVQHCSLYACHEVVQINFKTDLLIHELEDR